MCDIYITDGGECLAWWWGPSCPARRRWRRWRRFSNPVNNIKERTHHMLVFIDPITYNLTCDTFFVHLFWNISWFPAWIYYYRESSSEKKTIRAFSDYFDMILSSSKGILIKDKLLTVFDFIMFHYDLIKNMNVEIFNL